MILTTLIVSALSIYTEEPDRVYCSLQWTRRGQNWSAEIKCPDDINGAEELQAVANQILQPGRIQIEYFFESVGDAPGLILLDPPEKDLGFIQIGGSWDLETVETVHQAPPRYPRSASRVGVAGHCYGTVFLRANGRRANDSWVCHTNDPSKRNRYNRNFAYASREAVRDSYWLVPIREDSPCIQYDFIYNFQRQDGSQSTAPNFPEGDIPHCPE